MKIVATVSLSLLLLIGSFSYGIGVGLYRWFPFEEIREVKSSMFDNSERVTLPISLMEIDTNFSKISSDEAILLRENLRQAIIPPQETDVLVTSEDEIVVVETVYYGVSVRGEYRSALQRSQCLRIYVQGHGGNPNNFEYHNSLVREFIHDGCDVLSLSMLGLGFNTGPASFPTRRYGAINLTSEQATNHGNYSFFYDELNPQLDPLSLFLYPHLRLIDYFLEQNEHDNIAIMGISGGGWYTVWLAALIPELQRAVSYAGSLPLAYSVAGIHGDWEQTYSPLYRTVSYLELYQLMLRDRFGNQTRSAYLVYNDEDSCCFKDPQASDFKTLVDNLDFYPTVHIDENNSHTMNVALMLQLLQSE